MFRNFILDWSCTVVNDLDAVYRSTCAVLRHFGAPPVSRDEFRDRFELPWINFYKEILPHVPRADLERVFWVRMEQEQDGIHFLPHAREFLEFTNSQHLPVFVCSTVNTQSFWRQSNRIGATPLIRKAYVGIEDKRQVIQKVIEENQLDPTETLFVGDMIHDVETAHHGGLLSCAVLTGYDRESKLRQARPHYLLENLRELRLLVENQIQLMSNLPIATVGALIWNKTGECLMVQTRKWGNKWGIPGGKIRCHETADSALKREILEETGLQLDRIQFVMVQDCIRSIEFYRPSHFVLLNYQAWTDDVDVRLNDEAQAWQWVNPRKALGELDLNQPTRKLVEFVMRSTDKSVL